VVVGGKEAVELEQCTALRLHLACTIVVALTIAICISCDRLLRLARTILLIKLMDTGGWCRNGMHMRKEQSR
jgi:hypothetical protein